MNAAMWMGRAGHVGHADDRRGWRFARAGARTLGLAFLVVASEGASGGEGVRPSSDACAELAAQPGEQARGEQPSGEAGRQPKADRRPSVAEQTLDRQRLVWLQQHVSELATVDFSSEELGDLESIGRAIGNARVVLLGSATPGDGGAFQLKARLVKYLHQRRGFDVLAFESSFFDMDRVDRAMESDATWNLAAERGLAPTWAQSEQCRPLLEYVRASRQTGEPLRLAGIDCQFTTPLGKSEVWDEIERFFLAADGVMDGRMAELLTRLKVWHMERGFMDEVRVRDESEMTDEQLAAMREVSEQVAKQLKEYLENLDALVAAIDADLAKPRPSLTRVHPARRVVFMRQTLRNLKAATIDKVLGKGKARTDPSDINLRDRAMGENVHWLASVRYPDRKIIVWASSAHVVRRVRRISVEDRPGYFDKKDTMGDVVADRLGAEAYAIGVTAAEGSTGRPWTDAKPLDGAARGSLEWLMSRAGFGLGFLDLRGEHAPTPGATRALIEEPLIARPIGYGAMQAVWSECLDGVLFMKTMTPSTQAKLPLPPTEPGKAPEAKQEEAGNEASPRPQGERRGPRP
ncbi:MAG: erythromycin esterase family protein [Planctomycetota bacterium]|nr:erythromycin esterase family protein [Planctomycetota bacterium]